MGACGGAESRGGSFFVDSMIGSAPDSFELNTRQPCELHVPWLGFSELTLLLPMADVISGYSPICPATLHFPIHSGMTSWTSQLSEEPDGAVRRKGDPFKD